MVPIQFESGGPLECEVPKELKPYYSDLNGMETSAGVFKYSKTIEINDPSTERMKYLAFGFFSTILLGSGVVARGTDVASESNTNAINSSRQLSSVDPIRNRKMGRRGDTIFKHGSQELDVLNLEQVEIKQKHSATVRSRCL
ncbi:hypothetical protein BDC45DRAFT_606994 [Circinella umbellata]|nr:hypothetical protein BDC45DRAFT_606994 [Circinella umbellata]